MEARKIHAKNQIVMDLTPGTIAVIASPEEWREVYICLEGLALHSNPVINALLDALEDAGTFE